MNPLGVLLGLGDFWDGMVFADCDSKDSNPIKTNDDETIIVFSPCWCVDDDVHGM
jgi:hypothetical protein